MGKQQQSQKKHSRPQYNNDNPYNKLNLNKFHQIGSKPKQQSEARQNHKKIRDLQRLIKHKEQKGEQINEGKLEELKMAQEGLADRQKQSEKKMRKEYYLQNTYKQIKEIEMRKIVKKIRQLKEMQMTEDNKNQLYEWEKKQRYIKFFPKNLKYVSLFPNSKPLQEAAIQFQNNIMNDIESKHKKKTEKMNTYVSENKEKNKNKKRRDDFFIEEKEEQQELEEQEDQE